MLRQDLRVDIHTFEGEVVVCRLGSPDLHFNVSKFEKGATRSLALNAVAAAVHELHCRHGQVTDKRVVWQCAFEWCHVLLGRLDPMSRAKIEQTALQQFISQMIRQA